VIFFPTSPGIRHNDGMTDAQSRDAELLDARIRALEAENALLRASADTSTAAPPASFHSGRWRSVVSALCIVVAAILVPVSVVGGWARVQLVEEDAFVATLAPLVDDPDVQAMVVDETMSAITDQVDFDAVTASVFDGIAELGLPPRAASALGMLSGPAADGLENLVEQTVTRVVASDAFADVWATATRAAHRALTTAATSDGGGLVVRTEDGVGVQLGAVVERVKQNLVDRGVGAAQLIPTIDRVIILGDGSNLATVRTAYALAATLGWWLPIVTLALLAAGIGFARRRSAGVLGAGVALLLGGGVLAIALTAGGTAMPVIAADIGISASGLGVVYAQLVAAMTQSAVVLAVLGAVIALAGWASGGSAPAQAVRRTVRTANTAARRRLAGLGLDTGGFGRWLARYRVLVRTVVVIVAVLWLFALRPLTFGDAVVVLLVCLAGAWILELLQRRPDEGPAPTVAGAASDDAAG
jgi:hypothetical protein